MKLLAKIKNGIDNYIYNRENDKYTSKYMSRNLPESMTEEEMVAYLRKKIDELED